MKSSRNNFHGQYKVIFLAHKAQIADLLNAGFPIKQIHREIPGIASISYAMLTTYINRYFMEDEQVSHHQASKEILIPKKNGPERTEQDAIYKKHKKDNHSEFRGRYRSILTHHKKTIDDMLEKGHSFAHIRRSIPVLLQMDYQLFIYHLNRYIRHKNKPADLPIGF